MKKLFVLFVLLIVTFSCGKKETKFEAFSPEAFAYDIGDSWEVNAALRVKGFAQIEKDGTHSAAVKYSVSLIYPDGKEVDSVYSDKKNESKKEEIMDIPLEAQFNLDSSLVDGNYTLVFDVEDINSKSTATARVTFELKK
jgi:uncharacterized protein YfaS (alpha-2-macroglobulin family)